jgi:hypothetical protein
MTFAAEACWRGGDGREPCSRRRASRESKYEKNRGDSAHVETMPMTVIALKLIMVPSHVESRSVIWCDMNNFGDDSALSGCALYVNHCTN